MILDVNDYLDDNVIEAFRNGDSEAFERIYDRFHKHVYRLAYQYFNRDDMAKDIVQETFLKVYKYRKSLKSSNSIFSWIHRIAYTTCVAEYRKNNKDSIDHTQESLSEFTDNLKDERIKNSIQQVQEADAKAAVIEILSTMKKEWRIVAYLRFFEELSIKEISEITDSSVGTVSAQIKRIKEALSEQLGKRGFTKETCFSIILIPNLIGIFKEYNSQMQMSAKDNAQIKKTIKTSIQQEKKKSDKKNYALFALILLIPGAAIGLKNGYVQKALDTKEPAVITRIDYQKEWVNTPLKIDIETSNDKYDQILIDKQETNTVDYNGEHVIELIYDGKVIEQKIIEITNIDLHKPEISDENYEGDQLMITLNDTESGINYHKIKLYENGKEIAIRGLDKSQDKIKVKKDLSKDNQLIVEDKAGNILNVNIKFYEFSERK